MKFLRQIEIEDITDEFENITSPSMSESEKLRSNKMQELKELVEEIMERHDDLKEFEMKLAGVLMLKQKAWGIDKELLPMVQSKIKTIVQDARYQAVNGSTLKAIQKTVQRVEQSIDRSDERRNPYV